ncbi:MAG: hypothetical protein EXR79_06585 [Myxococcales bacterium]|nr:hypothetical protein [Myxococcales bacterium]
MHGLAAMLLFLFACGCATRTLAVSVGPAAAGSTRSSDATAEQDSPAGGSDAAGAAESRTSIANVGQNPAASCGTGKPPGPDAFVADVPPPPATCPAAPSPLFAEEAAPPPTLAVELGIAAPPDGAFALLAPGTWRPIDHGVQGGMHVAVGIRVGLPGEKAAKLLAQIHATAALSCDPVAATSIPARWLVQAAGAADAYTDVIPSGPPLWLIFPEPGTQSAKYCGRWLRLHVQVRIKGTALWGETTLAVRLYDGLVAGREAP